MFVELEAERALFETRPEYQIDALVAAIHENERPLSGLSGLLDWRFHGAISKCLRAGAINGQLGECTFLPVTKNGVVYRLILAGAGKSSSPGERSAIPPESLKLLHKNLVHLKLSSVGISRRDFGNPAQEYFSKNLKQIPLRVML
jgi:hypothetical protein